MKSPSNKTINIIRQYLGIQGLFVIRLLKQLAPHHVIFLLLFIAFGFFFLSTQPPYVPLVVYSLLILFCNVKMKDRTFLKMTVGTSYRLCYLALYSMISLPFLAVSVVSFVALANIESNWCILALYPVITLTIAFLPSLDKSVGIRISHPLLTKDAYEYLSGFRTQFVAHIVMFAISVFGAWHDNIRISKAITILMVFLVNLFYMSEYRCEYLFNYLNANAVFKLKFKNIVVNNIVCLLPFFLLLLVFDPTSHTLYTCAIIYVVCVETMASTLAIRIIFEKQDVATFLIVFVLIAFAITSVWYPIVILIYSIVDVALMSIVIHKLKHITRI